MTGTTAGSGSPARPSPATIVVGVPFPDTDSVSRVLAAAAERVQGGHMVQESTKTLGPTDVTAFFGHVFPGLVQNRGIGADTDWSPQTVVITTQLPETRGILPLDASQPVKRALYVGGHVAGAAAALHCVEQHEARGLGPGDFAAPTGQPSAGHSLDVSPERGLAPHAGDVGDAINVGWLVDNLGKSAAAGSAHYGHLRDSVQINFEPEIGPVAVLLATIRRFAWPDTVVQMEQPHWLKVVLVSEELLKKPAICMLLFGNFVNALHDQAMESVGQFERTNWWQMLRLPHEFAPYEKLQQYASVFGNELYQGPACGVKAVAVAFTEHEAIEQATQWRRVHQYAPNPCMQWDHEQLTSLFDPSEVAAVFEFRKDFLVNPYLVDILSDIVRGLGGQHEKQACLTKLHVRPDSAGSALPPGAQAEHFVPLMKVVGASYRDLATGEEVFLPAEQVFCSLGPSTAYRFQPGEPGTWRSLWDHALETMFQEHDRHPAGADVERFIEGSAGIHYSRTWDGVVRHAVNTVRAWLDQEDPNKLTMPAAGISITTMLSVPAADGALVQHCDELLQLAIGTTNSHWVLLDRALVTAPAPCQPAGRAEGDQGAEQRVVYALRGTSGGAFPSHRGCPGFIVNNMANQRRVFGKRLNAAIESGDAHFELVEARSCVRDVSSLNGFLANRLCGGLVAGYAYGGVGVVNGLPLGQLARILVSAGHTDGSLQRVQSGREGFFSPLHGRRVFKGIDFSAAVSDTSSVTARRLGVDNSLSTGEAVALTGFAAAASALTIPGVRLLRRLVLR